MVVPLSSWNDSTWPMPGMESLRSSLRTPSFASSRASSPKSELGATSNDNLMQCARSALLSWITSGPTLLARKARSFSRSATISPMNFS